MKKRILMFSFFLFFFLIINFFYADIQKNDNRLNKSHTENYIELPFGADISEGKYAQDKGVKYKDLDGKVKHYLDILKDHGFSWIRIRILVDPPSNSGLYQTTGYVKSVIKEAKSRNLKVLLVFFYSDDWCDPGKNFKPSNWPLNQSKLEEMLYNYTCETIKEIGAENIDMVSIGNEIDNEMCSKFGSNQVKLIVKGYDAVKSVSASIPVGIHSAEGSWSWFRDMKKAGAKFDVCFISHYLMWHGSIETLGYRIKSFENTGYKVWIIETAAYWKESDAGRFTHDYPQDQEGQLKFMKDIKRKASSYPSCAGIMYWGAVWSQSTVGVKWLKANWNDDDASCRSLFDDNAKATLGIKGWEKE
ncbi:MAG: glycosyl hydrolase 53 family protein [Spirochaetes bacterium]|nr:glycosyl hydrolase 53 family protein [Spirochaetota bacterium]